MKVLLVDAFDSFTYNLFQQLGRLGADVVVETIDAPLERLAEHGCARVVLSPGPGGPDEAARFREVLEVLSPRIPTLGVCLGHQAICAAFGGRVGPAATVVHGKPATIDHDGCGLFAGVPSPFSAVRYHSLAVDESSLPSDLVVTARAREDGVVMGVRHRHLPIAGVQFHPESCQTAGGDRIIANFLADGGAAQ
ncbi:MAG: aminodeoxychorismate/anthranilate synthase component II [Methanospirillum sp.]